MADNTSEEDGYLIWDFGPMGHGQSANIHVTVPVTTAETFDPDAQLTAADYDDGGMTADEMIGILTVVIGLLIFAAALIIIVGSMTPDWGGGFGSGGSYIANTRYNMAWEEKKEARERNARPADRAGQCTML